MVGFKVSIDVARTIGRFLAGLMQVGPVGRHGTARTGAAGAVLVAACLTLSCGPVLAQSGKESREKQAVRRAMQQAGKAEELRAAAEREKVALEEKLAAAGRELEEARKAAERLRARAAALERQVEADGAESRELRERLRAGEQTLAEARNEMGASLRGLERTSADERRKWETERAALQADLLRQQGQTSDASARVQSCEDKNRKLAGIASELMQRYREKGIWSALTQSEPVLGLGAVASENLIEEYRDRIDASRIRSDGR